MSNKTLKLIKSSILKVQPVLIVLAGLFPYTGCDKPTATAPQSKKALYADFKMLASLRANQRTLIAAGNNEQVYFVQPDTDGSSAIRMIKNDGQIVDTEITAANISKLIGKPNSRGIIRSMTSIPGGKILLYYAGTDNAESLATLLIYDIDSKELRIFMNTTELATQSGLGILLDIADVQLAYTGGDYWIWLSGVDTSAFLRIDARTVQDYKPGITQPFNRLLSDAEDFKPTSRDFLFGDCSGTLYLMQENPERLFQITTSGQAIETHRRENRPFSLLPPVALSERNLQGQTFMLNFYPSDQLLDPSDPITLKKSEAIAYPALEVTNIPEETIIDQKHINIRAGFPVHAIRLRNWQPVPNSSDVIAYDAMSGEIFRIHVTIQ